MKKKKYQKPEVMTMCLVEDANVLAASGDVVPTVEIEEEEEITDGFVDSKAYMGNDIWDWED